MSVSLSRRNYRHDSIYFNSEPVAGNYYPVTSRIFIKVSIQCLLIIFLMILHRTKKRRFSLLYLMIELKVALVSLMDP